LALEVSALQAAKKMSLAAVATIVASGVRFGGYLSAPRISLSSQ
jgi:hypothetical protein